MNAPAKGEDYVRLVINKRAANNGRVSTGTHVGNTNQIGHIEITKVKSKGAGKLRVEYTLVD